MIVVCLNDSNVVNMIDTPEILRSRALVVSVHVSVQTTINTMVCEQEGAGSRRSALHLQSTGPAVFNRTPILASGTTVFLPFASTARFPQLVLNDLQAKEQKCTRRAFQSDAEGQSGGSPGGAGRAMYIVADVRWSVGLRAGSASLSHVPLPVVCCLSSLLCVESRKVSRCTQLSHLITSR